MATTTPLYTQTDLQNITQALASNAKEVRFADRTVTYRSVQEMLEQQTVISNYLNAQNNTPVVRQYRMIPGTGF